MKLSESPINPPPSVEREQSSPPHPAEGAAGSRDADTKASNVTSSDTHIVSRTPSNATPSDARTPPSHRSMLSGDTFSSLLDSSASLPTISEEDSLPSDDESVHSYTDCGPDDITVRANNLSSVSYDSGDIGLNPYVDEDSAGHVAPHACELTPVEPDPELVASLSVRGATLCPGVATSWGGFFDIDD